jgi:hypothetical protein
MFHLDERNTRWNFPTNNYSQIIGISDSGIETFNGTPILSLAREICQNSIDARLSKDQPTRIEFHSFEIPINDVPDKNSLGDAFIKSLAFWGVQNHSKIATDFFRKAIAELNNPSIKCLRISDFNTTGLLGSDKEYNSPWCNLTKSQGTSDKTGADGGSFGIGKFAPFACSKFRTVFYSTLDSDGIKASQGVARLTSFKNDRNEITQGIGFYGNKNNTPLSEQLTLDPSFQRTEPGTDIYILAFNENEHWIDDMIKSVLDGFLFAVYQNELVVKVDDVIIEQSTLPDLVQQYADKFSEHADEYYTVLMSDESSAPVFEKDIEKIGHLTLKIMIQPGFHRKVAMVRETGMKIMDKGNISSVIPFAAVLYIQGEKLNQNLRLLENPQHTKWEVQRADNVPKARKLVKSLRTFVCESLSEMKKMDTSETLDPSVGEYLASDEGVTPENDNQKNEESLSDRIHDIQIKTIEKAPRSSHRKKGKKKRSVLIDDEFDIDNVEGVGNPTGEGDGRMGDTGGKGGNAPGDHGNGNNRPINNRKVISVAASKARVICKNSKQGVYKIIFTPAISATNGVLEMKMSAESGEYNAEIISAEDVNGNSILVDSDRIIGLEFNKGKQIVLNIKINYHDICSMEVEASGNKI